MAELPSDDQTTFLFRSALQIYELPSNAWPATLCTTCSRHFVLYPVSPLCLCLHRALHLQFPPLPLTQGLLLQGPAEALQHTKQLLWRPGPILPSQADLVLPVLPKVGIYAVTLTSMVEKDTPLALAPIRGHSEFHPQCLA